MMLREVERHVARGEDFALETTLAGRRYVRAVPRWQARGYRVGLIYLSLPSPDIAIARVASRVRQGGHDVAEDVIRRRFDAGRRAFEHLYKPLVDEWWHYDNSGERPRLVARGMKA